MTEKEQMMMAKMQSLRSQIKEAQADLIEHMDNAAVQKNISLKKEWDQLRTECNALVLESYVKTYDMLLVEIKKEFLLAGVKEFRKRTQYKDVEVVEVEESIDYKGGNKIVST